MSLLGDAWLARLDRTVASGRIILYLAEKLTQLEKRLAALEPQR